MARDLDELSFSITSSTSACGVPEFPMRHSHPGSSRNLLVPMARWFHECFSRSAKERPTWLKKGFDAFVHLL